jgi:pimeloyl-ACP methyl ester carboxylesterase
VGAADSFAPSRVVATSPERDRMQRGDPLTRRLLRAGIAVARTDYEGLGTPGPHPYLSGLSEARSVIDIVRAAREIEPRIGRRWAVVGHSQGGQAALFTASIGNRWAPELRLRGAASLAPASHMSEIVGLASSFTTVNAITGGLSALGGMILDGAALVHPSLREAYAAGGLSPAARALMKDVGDRCLEALGKPDSWGGIAPAAIIGPAADKVHLLYAALDAGDAAGLRITGVPVRLEQGLRDLVVFPKHTQALYDAYRARGTDVTYVTYPEGDHARLAGDAFSAKPITAWARERLR